MCVGVCVGVCLWEGLCVCVYGGDAVAARVAQSDMALAKRCARNPRSKSHLPLHRALLAERRHEELRETLQGAAQVAGRDVEVVIGVLLGRHVAISNAQQGVPTLPATHTVRSAGHRRKQAPPPKSAATHQT